MLGDLRQRAGNAPIRGGLYYSCCARGPNQFGDNSEELGLIADELGDYCWSVFRQWRNFKQPAGFFAS